MTDDELPGLTAAVAEPDAVLDAVADAVLQADPDGGRAAAVFRATFDQLYDGQHTGRYKWDQLFKTEKTHYGTLLEINLRREFDDVIDDGDLLDYQVLGHDIDCKYSQRMGGWMLPPESFGQLLLVATANDQQGEWNLGVVRASDEHRRTSVNRDGKTSLNTAGRDAIRWLHYRERLPPNVLLSLDPVTIGKIFAPASGQPRVNELLRLVTNRRIGRNTIATVAQQDDYMARLRDNGHGARTVLRREGIIVPGGDYTSHTQVATGLGAQRPMPGEVVSLPVVPAEPGARWAVELDGNWWRLAQDGEHRPAEAPKLPTVKKPRTT